MTTPLSTTTQLHIARLGQLSSLNLAGLYRALCLEAPLSFWLDSARGESPMSRFSYLGVGQASTLFQVQEAQSAPRLWAELKERIQQAPSINAEEAQAASYPLDAQSDILDGGYVGFMGYEAKNALGYASSSQAKTPDAWWLRADFYIAYEHLSGSAWAIGSKDWIAQVQQALTSLKTQGKDGTPRRASTPENLNFPLPDRADYLAKIKHAQQEIYEGNSYEVCLTAETSVGGIDVSHESTFELYLRQRQHNAAPYAAFLNGGDFWVLSSSPERFLTVTASGVAESKPIKGTVPRGASPEQDAAAAAWLAQDEKTRAENLMIVDLLRNDLSLVCQPGTVQVPVLMGVESYATVHQLVSTIRGQLREGVDAVDCAAACFPGGSMTGAPKPSTMQIIDELEGRARGIYSGFLGFFSADGAANLSIVIRTLIAHADGTVTLAAGGAIVADSDPQAEYEEMVAKLRAAVPKSAEPKSVEPEFEEQEQA